MASPYLNPREEAAAALQTKGFKENDGEWHGSFEGSTFAVRVKLPEDFPTSLPEVFVDRVEFNKQLPHVEKSGKVCIAPATGYLLDVANPEGIIAEALQRAAKVIDDALAGRSTADLQTEFLAYWNAGAEGILSICDVFGAARPIALARLKTGQGSIPSGRASLLADSEEEAERWIKKLHGCTQILRAAFFIPLETAFRPPDFEEEISTTQARALFKQHASLTAAIKFEAWLKTTTLPATVLFSLPLEKGAGRALAGLRFEPLTPSAQRRARNGFRPSKMSASVELLFASSHSCKRLFPERFDPEFLLPRGGASIELNSKSVAVIGCGAVGSHLVQQLAAAGVGEFRLVDPEDLINANCHRHVLGVKHVGTKKVRALAEQFSENYPHQRYLTREEKIQDLLRDDPDFVLAADLILVAVGEETLSLNLNRRLGTRRQMAVWLDPIGLGGHVLIAGDKRGCFECLFKYDSEHGLHNAASFAEVGQSFQKSFSGCAGVFTPFSALDANRIASVAARFAVKVLSQNESRSLLISWRGESQLFEQEGFRLSKRAQSFQLGEERVEAAFIAATCPVCSERP